MSAGKPAALRRRSAGDGSLAFEREKDEVVAWLKGIFRRADGGDEAAAKDVAMAFDMVPDLVELIPGLQETASERLLDAVAPRASGRLAAREHLRRQVDAVRDAAAGPAPNPLEGLLAGRVAVAWLCATIADLQYAEALAAGSAAEADRLLRRAGEAQRQFLRAVKTLATVRRLGVPALQVNVGAQQVNVAR